MKHFMIDFIELGQRKSIYKNALYCANKVGYFNEDNDPKSLESVFEKCLGKHSDSFESGLDILQEHISVM